MLVAHYSAALDLLRAGLTSQQHLQSLCAFSKVHVEDTMQTKSILLHARAVSQEGSVTLTIGFGSRATATLTLRPGENEHLITVINQALGRSEDDDTEPPVIDADG
jgi:hypothetical protein